MNYIYYLIISALCFAAGEYFSKDWANTRTGVSMFMSFLSYMIGVAVWFPAIAQKNHLAIVGTIWSILSLLATITIGVIVFKERLSTMGWVGIAFALVSVALLSGE